MWDYYVGRAPTNLPKLSIKTQNEKEIESLLKPIKNLTLPWDSDSDCSSGVVDAFEEFHKDSFLRPLPGTRTKFLTKQEADWKTVDQFTADYKKSMKEVRESLKLGDALTSEDIEAIEKELSSNEKHTFMSNVRKGTTQDPICIDWEVQQSETTSNSAVWNMIKAHRRNNFTTSPAHYDIYNLEPDHYLKRPHVAWQKVDHSRKKCEKWLEECELE